MSRYPLRLLVPAIALLWLGTVPGAHAQPRQFTELAGTLTTDADYEAWYTLRAGLDTNFDDICGDTFCEGDYSNIQSLRFTCSADPATGRIGMCTWILAGSYEDIDPLTGRISVHARAWRCRAPLAPRTTVPELLLALSGDRPLYATLPRTQQSIYDGLVDCL